MSEIKLVKIKKNHYILMMIEIGLHIEIQLMITHQHLSEICKKLENYEKWSVYTKGDSDNMPLCEFVTDQTILYENTEIRLMPEIIKIGSYVEICFDAVDLIDALKELDE